MEQCTQRQLAAKGSTQSQRRQRVCVSATVSGNLKRPTVTN